MTETQPAEVGGNPAQPTYEGAGLAVALAAVQAELTPIAARETGKVSGTTKDGKQYSYEYSYADLKGIAGALYPLMAKHGLSFLAGPTVTEQGRFVLRWKLLHVSGECETGDYPLPSDVKSPQALGSAITYGRRYCLSSVVGVVTDDDDGAAAEHAARDQAAAPVDPERADAVNRVAAAWHAHYGSVDWGELGAAYSKWSNGKRSQDASPADLRRFAAYLAALPAAAAGSDPVEMESPPPANGERPPVAPPKEITDDQRKKMFALMNELGITERQRQLAFLSRTVGRTLKSRSEVNFDDAKVIIDKLEKGGADVQAETGPRMAGRGQLRGLDGVFKDLGIVDGQERLHIASSIVGRTPVDGDGKPSATGLYADEATKLSTALATCKSRDDVEALIELAEQQRATEEGGES